MSTPTQQVIGRSSATITHQWLNIYQKTSVFHNLSVFGVRWCRSGSIAEVVAVGWGFCIFWYTACGGNIGNRCSLEYHILWLDIYSVLVVVCDVMC